MLVIRKAQMAVLSDYMRQRFEDRMVSFIAAEFPARFKELKAGQPDDQPVRKFVQEGIGRAGKYGIRKEREVASYIELMVLHGPDFEHGQGREPVLEHLQDPKLSEDAKIFAVQEVISGLSRRDQRRRN